MRRDGAHRRWPTGGSQRCGVLRADSMSCVSRPSRGRKRIGLRRLCRLRGGPEATARKAIDVTLIEPHFSNEAQVLLAIKGAVGSGAGEHARQCVGEPKRPHRLPNREDGSGGRQRDGEEHATRKESVILGLQLMGMPVEHAQEREREPDCTPETRQQRGADPEPPVEAMGTNAGRSLGGVENQASAR